MRKRRTIIISSIVAHSAAGSILAASADAEPEPARRASILRATPTGIGASLIGWAHSAESKWNAGRAARLRLSAVALKVVGGGDGSLRSREIKHKA